MDETTPRPIPPQLQGRYRDPIDLRGLLGAIFSPEQQAWVRDELLRRVIEQHGDVWIPVGDEAKGKTQRLSQRVRSFRSSPVKGIEYLVALEDIGGRAKGSEGAEHSDMILLLADIMQPRWAEWWGTFQNAEDVGRVGKFVLSNGQMRWSAAQFARSVFGDTAESVRPLMLAAIEAAEGNALGRVTHAQRNVAFWRAYRAATINEAESAAFWAAAGVDTNDVANAVINAAANAAWGTSWNGDMDVKLARLADLARRLFGSSPPALITRASRGVPGRAARGRGR